MGCFCWLRRCASGVRLGEGRVSIFQYPVHVFCISRGETEAKDSFLVFWQKWENLRGRLCVILESCSQKIDKKSNSRGWLMLSMVQKYKFEQILMHALLILFSLTVFTDANTFVGSESGIDWNEKSSLARLSNIKRLWRDGKSGWWTNYLTEGLDKSRTLGGGRFSRRRFGSADISRDRKTNSFLSVTPSLWGGQDTFSPNGLDHCVEIGNHNPLCGFIRTGRRGVGQDPLLFGRNCYL